MNTNEPNNPLPGIEFSRTHNGTFDAVLALDCLPNGLTVRVHEEWGKDLHLVTLEKPDLKITVAVHLFHLACLAETLREYYERLAKERNYPIVRSREPVPAVRREAGE